MAQPERPLRADAARNRARVLEVAYDTFAAEGLSVPIDEIARRAGVGAGTVYGDRSGVIKVIGDKKYGELVGGHIVGAKATELIQELVNAKALEGGYAEVARIVHGHPTLSEGVMEAARAADGWLIHG